MLRRGIEFMRGTGLCDMASLKGLYVVSLSALSGEGVE
jgi:hypothetical protein